MRSTRDSRLDLLLFGPGQGRSGCGVAALWCTTHAGFGHFSPTYRVPSGTSRAKSGRVYSAQTSMTVTRLVAGSAGLNAAGIMPKVHDMWVNCRFGRQAGPMSCHSVINGLVFIDISVSAHIQAGEMSEASETGEASGVSETIEAMSKRCVVQGRQVHGGVSVGERTRAANRNQGQNP